jgi:hypothetical protein
MRNTPRPKLDLRDLLAVSASLLGVVVIGCIIHTYDLNRRNALDDARAQAYLDIRHLHEDR